jgi:hypothetical protein
VRVCTLSRKPISGTVASNTLSWGCGGIAVDRCRIGSESRFNPPARCKGGGTSYNMSVLGMPEDAEGQWASGRWPANVVLGSSVVPSLEAQLGVTTNTRHMSYQRGGGVFIDSIADAPQQAWFTQETGCPVRFFKQIQEDTMEKMKLPQELLEYLYTMITPDGGETLILLQLDQVPFETLEDSRYHGVIAQGEPTPEQSAEMFRILRPGGHCMLVAPDENLIGDIGACTLEDSGFEIRDAILLVHKLTEEDDEVVPFYYVPKASRAEREAGCELLPSRTAAETVERDEGSAGMDSPRAGAGRTADKVSNFHPTVKPIEVMRKLLEGVPKNEGPILDPFMGSGSTGLACIDMGHSFIGIEKGEDYIPIAHARIEQKRNNISPTKPEIPLHSESPVKVDLDNYQEEPGDEDTLFGLIHEK